MAETWHKNGSYCNLNRMSTNIARANPVTVVKSGKMYGLRYEIMLGDRESIKKFQGSKYVGEFQGSKYVGILFVPELDERGIFDRYHITTMRPRTTLAAALAQVSERAMHEWRSEQGFQKRGLPAAFENPISTSKIALIGGSVIAAGLLAWAIWPKTAAAATSGNPVRAPNPTPAPPPPPVPAPNPNPRPSPIPAATWTLLSLATLSPGRTYRMSWGAQDLITIPNAQGVPAGIIADPTTLMNFLIQVINGANGLTPSAFSDPTARVANLQAWGPSTNPPSDWPYDDAIGSAGGGNRYRVQFGYGGTYSIGIQDIVPLDTKLYVMNLGA